MKKKTPATDEKARPMFFRPTGNAMLRTLRCFLLLAGVICSGCVAARQPAVKADQPGQQLLKVGITTNAPPMAYRENGKITGLEAEFAHGLAAYTGRKLRFVELKWEDQIPALLAGRTDIIMSAMTVTSARNYLIAFADPYMVTGQVSLVRLAEYNRFSNGFTDLLNPVVRVGTVKATTGDFLITRNKSKGTVIRYNNAAEAVQGLLDKKIDAFVYDLPMNFYLGARYADQGLTPVTIPMTKEFIAWGIRRDDPRLLEQANAYLQEIKSTGRLRDMIIRWIPFYERLYNKKS